MVLATNSDLIKREIEGEAVPIVQAPITIPPTVDLSPDPMESEAVSIVAGPTPIPTPPTAEEISAQNITAPTLPPSTQFEGTPQVITPEEVLKGQIISPTGAEAAGGEQVVAPAPTLIPRPEAETVSPDIEAVESAQGTVSAAAQVTAAQGVESPELTAAIASERARIINQPVDPRSTVQAQYAKLMDFSGDTVPLWANGAVRAAQQHLAARGIASSSTASGAITAALMQAALPIASQDAKVFQTMDLAKFDKEASIGLLRVSHLASLNEANLDNRQQAAVENARAFLNMDLTNLDHRQQTAIVNSQNRLQGLLSDQAQTNAMAQFNTSNEIQLQEFFADLGSRIGMFNSGQVQDISKFNSQLADSREKFNTSNALLIEQGNINYLRNINTANTALQNQENMVNSQNLLQISNTAMANALTLFRDEESYNFQARENILDRASQRALTEINANTQLALFDKNVKFQTGQAIGGLAKDIFGPAISSIGAGIGDWVGGLFGGDSNEEFADDATFYDEFGDDDFVA